MDSCSCVVDVGFESTDSTQLHGILEKYVNICPQHKQLHPHVEFNHKDDTAYQTARKENNTKNIVLSELVQSNILPLSMVNIKQHYDRKTRSKISPPTISLHDEVIYNYYFTGDLPNRQIVFSIEGLDKNGNVINFDNSLKSSIFFHLTSKGIQHQMVDHLHEDLHPEYKAHLENRVSIRRL